MDILNVLCTLNTCHIHIFSSSPRNKIVYHLLQVADNYYRPDLRNAALARLSAVHRSLKVAKSGVKKRNRQALKIRGRK